ncbi:TonB family protein [Candidatus Palauibacter sp.]|uniref:TonB family protein n=1 Tax=Candidatus Palauibacter sp. TaxID=3101350 RepID=UPI003AF2F8C0
MVITWIGYCLLVSALLGLAAYASERALGHYRKPVRWGWFAAIAGSVTAPVIAFVAPGLFPSAAPSPMAPLAGLGEAVVAPSVPAVPDPMTGPQAAAGLDVEAVSALLGWAWALLVLAMGFYLVRAYGRLRSEMRTWTPAEVQGSPVLLSADRGPAVVGVGCSVVVMPRWIAELEDRLLRLVSLHEREHQRAGDHRLFAAGIAALVLMPWNLFLWWQVSRLRLAIEFDCDRRVLARGESTRDYADALIAVGSRVSAPLLAAAAFAERKPAVERRLRRMTEPLARRRVLRTLGASGVAMLAVVFMLGCPTPENSLQAPEPPAATLTAPAAEAGTRAERPTFIPYDTNPVLQNAPEVTATLEAAYPADLKTAGVGGRAELWLYLDASGVVRNQQIKTTSGADALDLAATEVVKTMRFEPAMNRGQPTDAWVSQVVTFQVPDDAEPSLRSEGPEGERGEGEVAVSGVWDAGESSADFLDGAHIIINGVRQSEDMSISDFNPPDIARRAERPTFIPYDTNPVLQNAPEVTATLEAAYPADLKTAGVGGRAELWLYLDASGIVRNQQIKTTSGADALDLAATEVVKTMRFEPAMNRGQPTDAWVSQVVTFQVPDDAEPSLRSEGPDAERGEGEVAVSGVWDAGESSTDFLDGAHIIINGVRQSEDMSISDFNPPDIARLEFSRGDRAVERYGEWARDGVIEITTRPAGQGNARPEGSARSLPATDGAAGNPAVEGQMIYISGFVGPDGTKEHVRSTDNPLIVIDGVIQPAEVTLADVRPTKLDIANVEILKGEQAVDEYGERASGGVLRITTKAGVRDGGTSDPGP